MNTRRKYASILCSLVGLIAASGVASADLNADQGKQPAKSPKGITLQYSQPMEVRTDVDLGSEGEGFATPARDRQIPSVGGSCQLLYGANTRNGTGFYTMDDFRPTASGNITQVSWSGVYRNGLSPFTNGAPPTNIATDQFEISFFTQDPSGDAFQPIPLGSSKFGTQTLTVGTNIVRTVDGGTITVGGVTYTVYNYVATLTTPVPVTNTNCYYLSVHAISPQYDLAFTTTGYMWRWAWAATGQGNNGAIQADVANVTTLGNGTYAFSRDFVSNDYAFCLNINFDRNPPCKGTGQCVQSASFCQNYANGTDGLNSTNTTGAFAVADNFTVPAGGATVSGICFTGVYAGQPDGTVARPFPTDIAGAQRFTVNFYANNTAGSPAFSFPAGTPVATRIINTSTTPPVGESQARRNPARFNGPPITYFGYFEWNSTFASPVVLSTPGCYWIEIISESTTSWFWLSNYADPNGTLRNNGDNYCAARDLAANYTRSTQYRAADRAFCIGFDMAATAANCPAGPPAANETCATATALTIGAAAIEGFVLSPNGQSGGIPPTFADLIDPADGGVWYTVVGNGQNITITTCDAATDYDSRIGVYCASSCSGPFAAVAQNDDDGACTASAAGASTVTFPSVSGQTYYVWVTGAAFSFGFHNISATSAALGVITPTPCGTIQEPPATLSPVGTDFREDQAEACNNGTTTAPPSLGDFCQNPYPLAFDQTAFGNLSTDTAAGTRDRDIYRMSIDPSAGQTLNFSLLCEAPTLVFVFNAGATTCPAGTADPTATASAAFVIFPNGHRGVNQFQVPVTATNAGPMYIYVLAPAFAGLDCTANRNEYALTVSVAPLGACCVQSGTGCIETTIEDCADPAGSNGQWQGSGTLCQPEPPVSAPCDPNTGLSIAPVGACCFAEGGCLISTAAACTAGSVFQGAATTCTATACNAAQAFSCCFADGNCAILTSAACALQSGSFVSGRACLPNSCPTAAPTGSCCNPSSGACTVGLTQAQCTTGGGTNWTNGGTCSPNTCPQPTGACCNSVDGTCSVQAGATACTGLGGTFSYQGNGTTCSPNPCPQPSNGRCCIGSRCAVVTAANCVASGTAGVVFTAGQTNCNGAGVLNTPCCFADYNKAGGITVQDIFDFLTGWFGNSVNANVGGDGLAAPSVQDIFDFLSAWFSGGC